MNTFSYTKIYQTSVVSVCLKNGFSIAYVAQQLDLDKNELCSWVEDLSKTNQSLSFLFNDKELKIWGLKQNN